MKINKPTLLCWHAHRAGFEVLANTLTALANESIAIAQVIYLMQQEQHQNLPIPEELQQRVEIKRIDLILNDPTQHEVIYQLVFEKVLPKVKNYQQLHINISPGTPAMHAVWLLLHTGGAFLQTTRLWSSQLEPKTDQTILKAVEFSINTYLAEIHRLKERKTELAVYEPEAKSPKRKQALKRLNVYARLIGAPLLILGERGIGKTRLVETFVAKLKQRDNVVTVACGSLDSELADSLLFGHSKGAFTGANQERKGLLVEANGGILFLDEIQDLPKPTQRKLVRVLQDRQHRFRAMGSNKETSVNIEIVCASNIGLTALSQCLDADLFDRISHLVIEIPPLRECREDLAEDWKQVWKELRTMDNLPEQAPFSSALKNALQNKPLAGNLRDLQKLALLIMAWSQSLTKDAAIDAALSEWKTQQVVLTKPDHEFGEGTRAERINWFKNRLAQWAYEQQGTWGKAGKFLQCTEMTLHNDMKNNKASKAQ
ncbi:MAG: sigma 54-interacting transcriptional regulator [Methylococcales bacterium]|nr:sigma 54-interacting transcriptional regulator [Methylococcales bacterium]